MVCEMEQQKKKFSAKAAEFVPRKKAASTEVAEPKFDPKAPEFVPRKKAGSTEVAEPKFDPKALEFVPRKKAASTEEPKFDLEAVVEHIGLELLHSYICNVAPDDSGEYRKTDIDHKVDKRVVAKMSWADSCPLEQDCTSEASSYDLGFEAEVKLKMNPLEAELAPPATQDLKSTTQELVFASSKNLQTAPWRKDGSGQPTTSKRPWRQNAGSSSKDPSPGQSSTSKRPWRRNADPLSNISEDVKPKPPPWRKAGNEEELALKEEHDLNAKGSGRPKFTLNPKLLAELEQMDSDFEDILEETSTFTGLSEDSTVTPGSDASSDKSTADKSFKEDFSDASSEKSTLGEEIPMISMPSPGGRRPFPVLFSTGHVSFNAAQPCAQRTGLKVVDDENRPRHPWSRVIPELKKQEQLNIEGAAHSNGSNGRIARNGVQAASKGDEQIVRTIRGILNKLTLEKYDTLYKQILQCGICTVDHVQLLIREVLDKARVQHNFIGLYIKLCIDLNDWFVQSNFTEDPQKSFKKLLLNECQTAFEVGLSPHETRGLEGEALEIAKTRSKLRMLGNLKFVGGLLVEGMLASSVIVFIAEELVSEPRSAEALESLSAFLHVVGGKFDRPSWHHYDQLDALFSKLKVLTTDSTVSMRIRFLLRNLLDLREAGW